MPDKTNEHSDQLIGLTDLMVETMEATIDADRRTAEEYYHILEENSFVQSTDGQSSELQMVNVRITNPSGQTQIVSIPKMILMPVPMLHISEATFEIEGNMCLNTTEDTSSGRTVPQRVTTPKKGVSEEKLQTNASIIRRNLTVRLANASERTTENAQSSTNLKVSVKMTQSDMPSGLVNLLQVMTNNIQVKNE